jgi:hypothetical protein
MDLVSIANFSVMSEEMPSLLFLILIILVFFPYCLVKGLSTLLILSKGQLASLVFLIEFSSFFFSSLNTSIAAPHKLWCALFPFS